MFFRCLVVLSNAVLQKIMVVPQNLFERNITLIKHGATSVGYVFKYVYNIHNFNLAV